MWIWNIFKERDNIQFISKCVFMFFTRSGNCFCGKSLSYVGYDIVLFLELSWGKALFKYLLAEWIETKPQRDFIVACSVSCWLLLKASSQSETVRSGSSPQLFLIGNWKINGFFWFVDFHQGNLWKWKRGIWGSEEGFRMLHMLVAKFQWGVGYLKIVNLT